MKRGYLSFFCDFIFFAFIIFSITFIWLRYYLHNNTLLWIITSLITLILSFFIALYFRKKINKFNLSKKEKKEKQKYLNYILFLNKNETNKFLKDIYKDRLIESHSNYLIILNKNTEKNEIKYIKNSEKCLIFYDFSMQNLTSDSLVAFIKKAKSLGIRNVEILCKNYDKECKNIIKNLISFNVSIKDFDKFYSENIKNNKQDSFEIIYEEKNRYRFKELLGIAFNKSKTKTYALTGLIFLLGSIFMRYNVYYLVFTTIMFAFALFSHFNKIYNKT